MPSYTFLESKVMSLEQKIMDLESIIIRQNEKLDTLYNSYERLLAGFLNLYGVKEKV